MKLLWIEQLPENVDSIQIIEKPLEPNNIEYIEEILKENDYNKKIVKKVINFKDGTSEVILYQK